MLREGPEWFDVLVKNYLTDTCRFSLRTITGRSFCFLIRQVAGFKMAESFREGSIFK